MKIIYNKWIPFWDYKTFNFFGILFTKEDLSEQDKNHEEIHTVQILECAIALFLILSILVLLGVNGNILLLSPFAFYIWYIIEYFIIRILKRKDKQEDCYYNVSLEEEAYNNSSNLNYIENRKPFSWIKYLNIKKYEVNS